MRSWGPTAQSYLDGNGTPTYEKGITVRPRRFDTNETVVLAYWSGNENISVVIDGVTRTFQGIDNLLRIDRIRCVAGTNVGSVAVDFFGLSDEGKNFYLGLDTEQAPVEIYNFMFNAGGRYLGYRDVYSGLVDDVSMEIGANGSGASVRLEVVPKTGLGTRIIEAKKSNAHYFEERNGDTSMEYASLKGVEGDEWGPT